MGTKTAPLTVVDDLIVTTIDLWQNPEVESHSLATLQG
jgi:hypothetical protein